jgi:hypothetical protein
MLQNTRSNVQNALKEFFEDHATSKEGAPQNEVPTGSVPKTGEQPDNENVSQLELSISTQIIVFLCF